MPTLHNIKHRGGFFKATTPDCPPGAATILLRPDTPDYIIRGPSRALHRWPAVRIMPGLRDAGRAEAIMYPKVWTPHVTVAAIIEREEHYLLVEEIAEGARVYNQPAGHLEPEESLQDAVVREVLEEAATHFRPQGIVGVYRWINPENGETHMRVAFHGQTTGMDPGRPLDEGIVAPHWLPYEDIAALGPALRSPMVLGCLDDYRRGQSFDLALLRDLA